MQYGVLRTVHACNVHGVQHISPVIVCRRKAQGGGGQPSEDDDDDDGDEDGDGGGMN
ncbi:predicted protein [Histoplasma mississippiense (nom. inval.)]|uniref:predicted protein n=1 Tax=Ajellomyces capsulatus (strain NAm1 / WU24) TaxID=2059318 RepID=UPI000157CDC1|nr:predicted protein [Histoplasma mississippiense (nom. inval.)]EDN10180.1 predicted protein [Histoplasma mississippiense (nom. inval.)]